MKSLVKAMICGAMILAVNLQANAGGAAVLETKLLAPAIENGVLQKFAAERLGVRTGASLAEIQRAIGALKNPTEKLAVIAAFNKFGKEFADAKGNTVLIGAAANMIFQTSNGQSKQLGDLVASMASRENVAAQTMKSGPSCDAGNTASELGLSLGTVTSALKSQLLDESSACVLNGSISKAGMANAYEAAAFASDLLTKEQITKVKALARGLKFAVENDPAVDGVQKTLGLDKAEAAVCHLAAECHVFNANCQASL